MQKLLEVTDQILFGKEFRISFHPPEAAGTGFLGSFYQVAASMAWKATEYAHTHQSVVEKVTGTTINTYIELRGANRESQKFLESGESVPEKDLRKAYELFYRAAPAQAWLLLASGLARPKELGLSLVDTSKSILVLGEHRIL